MFSPFVCDTPFVQIEPAIVDRLQVYALLEQAELRGPNRSYDCVRFAFGIYKLLDDTIMLLLPVKESTKVRASPSTTMSLKLYGEARAGQPVEKEVV